MADRYYKFSKFLHTRYGEKVWKICLDAGLSCPNRDPQTGSGGCIFCRVDSFNSLQFQQGVSVSKQIEMGVQVGHEKKGINKFIAYFQSSTNTFAPVPQLRELFYGAIAYPGIVGLAIATRPDCLPAGVVDLIAELAERIDVWVELGLQSANNRTLQRIGRGHSYEEYCRAVDKLAALPVRICTHIMLGLPEEGLDDTGYTAKKLADSPIHEVKIHPMLILRGTALESLYLHGEVKALQLNDYVRGACDFIQYLPGEMVIQRLTAEAPEHLLIAPQWAANKHQVLNSIEEELVKQDTWQGKARGVRYPPQSVL
ncbi:MAG TPA: TIGR01212 family radical SAM protein [bacterium]|nr:TIGR01212 family radical SAM protein [bacterium]HNT64323.1 TIGR01212 family radical SAM protein [bacterium]